MPHSHKGPRSQARSSWGTASDEMFTVPYGLCRLGESAGRVNGSVSVLFVPPVDPPLCWSLLREFCVGLTRYGTESEHFILGLLLGLGQATKKD